MVEFVEFKVALLYNNLITDEFQCYFQQKQTIHKDRSLDTQRAKLWFKRDLGIEFTQEPQFFVSFGKEKLPLPLSFDKIKQLTKNNEKIDLFAVVIDCKSTSNAEDIPVITSPTKEDVDASFKMKE